MVTGESESRPRASEGALEGALSPFVLMGLGVLSHKNIGQILSRHAGVRDGENQEGKSPFKHNHAQRRNVELYKETHGGKNSWNRDRRYCANVLGRCK